MATIILGLCCLSSMLGGGYMAYDMMKIAEREKLYENTPGFHGFTECDYKGEGVIQFATNVDKMTEEDESVHSGDIGIKSLIMTNGFKVDTYSLRNLQGVKITYTGPVKMKCLGNSIKSIRFYKS